jgi:hypothetical protein
MPAAPQVKFTQEAPPQQSASTLQLWPAVLHVPESAWHVFAGAPVEGSHPLGTRQAAVAGLALAPQHSSSTEQDTPFDLHGEGTR